jgi:DNA-binding NtrC family response regulator
VTAKRKPGSGLAVLVVDDEAGIRSMCREFLEQLGCEVTDAKDVASARSALAEGTFGLALLDVRLPDGSGLELFHEARKQWPDMAIAIITGYASVEDAIEAVKNGACDYITKPFDLGRLEDTVNFAVRRLPAPEAGKAGDVVEFHGLVFASAAMRSVCDLIKRAAQCPSTVLIEGESGTGKELVARAVHLAGPESAEPFVPVDCSSIPGSLLESELFGHVKGAFTGAHAGSKGLFRAAGRGTVFLDEIGELPQALQAKLLRSLQEREVRPLGSAQPKPFKARVIVATNRDLRSAMASGKFRRDLFYRLHVIPVYLPPLRARRDDIAPLAEHFLKQVCKTSGRRLAISQGALHELEERDWPGNARELQNCIERAAALATGDKIDVEQLVDTGAEPEPAREGDRMADYEKQAIEAALRKSGGNRQQAARILDIGVATLFRKLKKYGLS